MTVALKAFVAGMGDQFGVGNVASSAPADLDTRLPFHRVTRASGGDQNYRYDLPVFDVDTFAVDESSALDAAEAVRTWVRTLPGSTIGGAFINATGTVMAPRWLPWDNTSLRRVTATYRLTLH